jgi:hypothetical protein
MPDLKKIKLIVSDEKPKTGAAKTEEFHIVLVDENFSTGKTIAARLCGGTSTCVALMDTE